MLTLMTAKGCGMIPLTVDSPTDDSFTTPLVDWPFFVGNTHVGCIANKYISKYIKLSTIGAMLRSFFQKALPATGAQ